MSDRVETLSKTVLYEWHRTHARKMADFGGFHMPIEYEGTHAEHLATRGSAGLFDISHMGRFVITGADAVPFLQYSLTNNVAALDEVGMAQYTLIPDENGCAVDDAYLYRIRPAEYLLVVNASNRAKDWDWLKARESRFSRLEIKDESEALAMIALQGPNSEEILGELLGEKGSGGLLPEPMRNRVSIGRLRGAEVFISRTGYTGETICFELFPPSTAALMVWEAVIELGEKYGVVPVGLGARDTLRLEAGLPLYGHELGADPCTDGLRQEKASAGIPIFALALGRYATSFAEVKGDFVGREALWKQHVEVRKRLRDKSSLPIEERFVPYFIRQLAVLNLDRTEPAKQPLRQGDPIFLRDEPAGVVTSGTTVPNWDFDGSGVLSRPADGKGTRSIAMAYLDSAIVAGKRGQFAEIRKRNRSLPALVVGANMRVTPPYSRPVVYPEKDRKPARSAPGTWQGQCMDLVKEAVENTRFRQQEAVNLIPSEQTPSLLVRLLSILDPCGRYAEHQRVKAFGKTARDVYYYQGVGFIRTVEEKLVSTWKAYLGCTEIDVRIHSGLLANEAVFGGLVRYVNRKRRGEPERIGYVLNHHLRKGGHLSAQPLGTGRHFFKRDPATERYAVVNFPATDGNPYKIDVEATKALIEQYHPQLIVLGKSLILHAEPVRAIADFVGPMRERPIVMYDMAHVLGLAGRHFQQPFAEGADLVTGSTHKTFFGTQRGIVASRMTEGSHYRELWEGIVNEVFPGKVSNHHLGTLLGLLAASYEMMAFRDEYQPQVIANAKAFARALHEAKVQVEGDPAAGYTETHQVVLRVGKGEGPRVAERLEASRIITNYQGLPDDASFSDASGIRLGVQEMTRFGMKERDFARLAGYMADVILDGGNVAEEITRFREPFRTMQYCFPPEQAEEAVSSLIETLRA